MIYKLYKLKNNKHKFVVINENGKQIKFGASGYEDYTMHHDIERKKRYIMRHKTRENWNDLNRAGTWSRYLLWEKPNLDDAIKSMERKFNIVIDY